MDADELRRLIGRFKGSQEQLEEIAEVGLNALKQVTATAKGDVSGAARFSTLFFEWVRDGSSPTALEEAAAYLNRLSAPQRDNQLSVFASVVRSVTPILPEVYRDVVLSLALKFVYRVGVSA